MEHNKDDKQRGFLDSHVSLPGEKSGSFLKLIRMRTIHYNQHNQETDLPLPRLFIFFFSPFRAGLGGEKVYPPLITPRHLKL